MKNKIQIGIFLSIFLSVGVFAQPKISKVSKYFYDANLAEWRLTIQENYEYEDENLSFYFIKEDMPFNNALESTKRIYQYYDQGKPLLFVDSIYHIFGNYWEITREEFIYEEDLLVEQFFFNLNMGIDSFFTDIKTVFHYNDLDLPIKEEIFDLTNPNNGVVRTTDYEYDENGCLSAEIIDAKNDDHIIKKEFINTSNCEVISEIYYQKIRTADDFHPEEKTTYHHVETPDGYILIDSIFYHTITLPGFQEWHYSNREEREFDYNGNLIRRPTYLFNTIYYERRWKYDTQNRLINEQSLDWDSAAETFFVQWETDYVYSFDENDFITALNIFRYNHSGLYEEKEILYEPYCNGSPAISFEEDLFSSLYQESRTYYEYLEGVDCDFDDSNSTIKVFPNPTAGLLTIKSDFLQGESTIIKVFNTLGQMVFEQKSREQQFLVELDLSFLSNGNYVVFVENGEHFSTEKIMIWR